MRVCVGALFVVIAVALRTDAQEQTHDRFVGDWSLDFDDGYGGWLSVRVEDGQPVGQVLWRVGSARRAARTTIDGKGRLILEIPRGRPRTGPDGKALPRPIERYIATQDGDTVSVTGHTFRSGQPAVQKAGGRRLPPMPARPDLKAVTFGDPLELLNDRDLTGWKLQPPKAKNGWSVQDGVLTNTTPKTDFSGYGEFGNLQTERQFEDFQLHIEFNVPPNGNSGVYLRGVYEAQVVDRDSRMQGISGPGAVFGRVEPLKNAGRPGGQWQTYDLTLVDRHITVVLNGEKVVDNQPVPGCTGGALSGDVTRPGPIYLQGDHTSIRYRNIVLRPRVTE